MDLQEKRKLDAERLASQLAHVKERARPWRSIAALVVAIAAGIAAAEQHVRSFGTADETRRIIAASLTAAFCVLGIGGVAGLSAKARDVLQPRVGSAHAAVVRYAILLAGGITVLILTLELFTIPVGQLIVGGALTAVLLGIAAQQTMSNLFAGIVLLFSRPFAVGDKIRVRSGALGGLLEGTVTEIGITYLRLDTGDGILALPNAQVLAAAVGPAPLQPAPMQPPERRS